MPRQTQLNSASTTAMAASPPKTKPSTTRPPSPPADKDKSRSGKRLTQPTAHESNVKLSAKSYNANLIGPSKFDCRHALGFQDPDFQALKDLIASAGGNIVPIKIRRAEVQKGTRPSRSSHICYEVIYGHRRLRACLELGYPVLAFEEQVSDDQLLEEMLVENSLRKNLSAWELGRMFKKLLPFGESKRYDTQAELAKALHQNESEVCRAITIANLPDEAIDVITSPREFALHDASAISKALRKDMANVMLVAKQLKAAGTIVTAREFLKKISGSSAAEVGASKEIGGSKTVTSSILWDIDGKAIGASKRYMDGHMTLDIAVPMDAKQQHMLEQIVLGFVKAL